MSNSIKFIDNLDESGDWTVILFNGEVVHEGHTYPSGYSFVEFFKEFNGQAEHVEHIHMTDEQIEDWRVHLYGEDS